MRRTTTTLAIMALSGTAAAQPAVFTDLGDRSTTQTFTQAVTLTAPSDIQWFRIVLPAAVTTTGHVDIWTTPTADPAPATDMTDTEIGLYNNAGNGAAPGFNDDDDGPANYSALSFGSTTSRGTTTFAGLAAGADRNGRDGILAAGVYWLAVGRFNVTFNATGFGVTSTYTGTQTTAMLNFDIAAPTESFPPAGAGAVNPTAVSGGASALFTVAVTPGGVPTSTGITVTGNLSSVGGGATAAFHDDGLNGDATAGDGVYSFQHTLPASATDATFDIPVTVADAQARSAELTIRVNTLGPVSWDEATGSGDAGQTIETAQSPSGSGAINAITGTFDANDVDIYKINICNAGAFSASTRLTAPLIDTQLFLFRPDGTGVVVNDDVPTGLPADDTTASTMTNALVTTGGEHYLAISRYNIDPVDASNALLWANTPFDTERVPDGPGAANPFASWTGTNGTTGNYRISFTGVCFPSAGPLCGLADLGGVGGVPGADNHLDNNDFVVFIDFFFNNNPLADQGGVGGAPGADGVWDNNDFVVFIDNFFNAPASCR